MTDTQWEVAQPVQGELGVLHVFKVHFEHIAGMKLEFTSTPALTDSFSPTTQPEGCHLIN